MAEPADRNEADRWGAGVKVFFLLPAAVGYEEFAAAWRSCQTPEVDGLRRYVQTMPAPLPGSEAAPEPWAFGTGYMGGVGELWFDSAEEFAQVRDELSSFYAHELGLAIDRDRVSSLVASEYPVLLGARIEADTEALKATFFPRRKAGLFRGQFLDHWSGAHAEIAGCSSRAPGNIRYIQCASIDSDGPVSQSVDGVAEMWWRDASSFAAALESKEFLEDQFGDAAGFCNLEANFGFAGEEERRLWP